MSFGTQVSSHINACGGQPSRPPFPSLSSSPPSPLRSPEALEPLPWFRALDPPAPPFGAPPFPAPLELALPLLESSLSPFAALPVPLPVITRAALPPVPLFAPFPPFELPRAFERGWPSIPAAASSSSAGGRTCRSIGVQLVTTAATITNDVNFARVIRSALPLLARLQS
jgi:hypothetical protein